jgi:hypothetical protein
MGCSLLNSTLARGTAVRLSVPSSREWAVASLWALWALRYSLVVVGGMFVPSEVCVLVSRRRLGRLACGSVASPVPYGLLWPVCLITHIHVYGCGPRHRRLAVTD